MAIGGFELGINARGLTQPNIAGISLQSDGLTVDQGMALNLAAYKTGFTGGHINQATAMGIDFQTKLFYIRSGQVVGQKLGLESGFARGNIRQTAGYQCTDRVILIGW